MVDTATYKDILEARREELQARLNEIETTLDSHHSNDWEEAATEREGDEVLERMGTSGQEELVRIEAALARVATGDFGYCVTCGAEIAAERLDLVPYTPFCRNCAGAR